VLVGGLRHDPARAAKHCLLPESAAMLVAVKESN